MLNIIDKVRFSPPWAAALKTVVIGCWCLLLAPVSVLADGAEPIATVAAATRAAEQSTAGTTAVPTAKALRERALAHIAPLPEQAPAAVADNAALVHLGRTLFHEPLLSLDVKHACASCHRYAGGVGGLKRQAVDSGPNDAVNTRNTPTVLNVALQTAYNWDGSAASLAEHARAHILNPTILAMPSPDAVMKRLNTNPSYGVAFKVSFRDAEQPETFEHVLEALAAYQRTLITRDRFDDFLTGDDQALSTTEQQGLALFIATGCVECHNGPLLGGNRFAKLGRHGEYPNTSDSGRYPITNDETDRMVFKVPSLRNVAITAPYFHDGQVTHLNQAVRMMAELQLGRQLSDEDVKAIVAFLHSLTDKRQL